MLNVLSSASSRPPDAGCYARGCLFISACLMEKCVNTLHIWPLILDFDFIICYLFDGLSAKFTFPSHGL